MQLDMTESTLQWVIRVFVTLITIVVAAVVGLLIFVIVRDGNSDLVSQSYTNLVSLAQWGIGIIGAVIVGKPIASGIGNLLAGKALQASTTNVSVAPSNIPVQNVTPPASPTAGQP